MTIEPLSPRCLCSSVAVPVQSRVLTTGAAPKKHFHPFGVWFVPNKLLGRNSSSKRDHLLIDAFFFSVGGNSRHLFLTASSNGRTFQNLSVPQWFVSGSVTCSADCSLKNLFTLMASDTLGISVAGLQYVLTRENFNVPIIISVPKNVCTSSGVVPRMAPDTCSA